MSRTGSIHPNITSIIRLRDQIATALYTPPLAPEDAVNQMGGLISILEPKDIDTLKTTFQSINEETAALAKSRSRSLKTRRIQLRLPVYKDWFLEINKILWTEGYLKNDKYKSLTLAELREDEGFIEA